MSNSKSVVMAIVLAAGLPCLLLCGTKEQARVLGDEAPAAAGQKPAAPDEIAKLIKQLDADQYAERQAAGVKLLAIGKAAIPALAQAAAGDSLEVTTSAVGLLGKLLGSPDAATKGAANAALETIVKSGPAAAAQRARALLKPKSQPQVPVFPGPAVFPGGMAVGRVQIQVGGAGVKRMSVKQVNGVKEIEVGEDGKEIKIHDDPQQGIKMEIKSKKDGKEVTESFEAKNAEDLKKRHPAAYKVYQQYAENQQNGRRGRVPHPGATGRNPAVAGPAARCGAGAVRPVRAGEAAGRAGAAARGRRPATSRRGRHDGQDAGPAARGAAEDRRLAKGLAAVAGRAQEAIGAARAAAGGSRKGPRTSKRR